MGILEKNFKKKVVPYLTTGGPRPALWNQDLLTAERDKYDANDVKPGLTGWAQINGRDELEIGEKAKLDGEYVKKISFPFDVKCFARTIFSVAKSDPHSRRIKPYPQLYSRSVNSDPAAGQCSHASWNRNGDPWL